MRPMVQGEGEHAHSTNLWGAQEEGRMVPLLFSVLCQLPGSTRGRLVSPSRRQGQPEHLRNASKSSNQRLWQSGTWLWEAGLAQEGCSLLHSDWTLSEPSTDRLLGPCLARVTSGNCTTISVFPFSIILCSLVFSSKIPELYCLISV